MSSPEMPSYVTDDLLHEIIGRALEEDVGPGDVTTEATVSPEISAQAALVAKADGILAGQHVAELVLAQVDPRISATWTRTDGQAIYRGTTVGRLVGPAAGILTAERLMLNLLQRMSGIATVTHRYVDAVQPHSARILDTRKTAPGLRILDKWAVRLGGGENHRVGLYDMILVKDNHIAAAGGIAPAVEAAKRYRTGRDLRIEIETRRLGEVEEVLRIGGVDMILLDNMVSTRADGRVDTSILRDAVRLVSGSVRTEASGNVTLETAEPIARTGVDFISCGALTHSVAALDISLQMQLVED